MYVLSAWSINLAPGGVFRARFIAANAAKMQALGLVAGKTHGMGSLETKKRRLTHFPSPQALGQSLSPAF